MITNLTLTDLARLMAHVADALAGYEHLPRLGRVSVSSYAGGRVTLNLDIFEENRLGAVATWAKAFDTPVVIDLSSTGAVFAVVQLGGVEATVRESISHRDAYELGAALGIPVTLGGQVEVPAAALRAALDTTTTTTTAAGAAA